MVKGYASWIAFIVFSCLSSSKSSGDINTSANFFSEEHALLQETLLKEVYVQYAVFVLVRCNRWMWLLPTNNGRINSGNDTKIEQQ